MSYKIRTFANSTELKSKNRRFTVIKPVKNIVTNELQNFNIISIKTLIDDKISKDTNQPIITCNGKVKETLLGLTDNGLLELYITLDIHFREKHNTKK